MSRICLLTPGQPATNPRLVKEADALSEAGHDVHVIAAHWIAWADEMDNDLLASRSWTCTFVGGHPRQQPVQYKWTRARLRFSRAALAARPNLPQLQLWSIARVLPELEREAMRIAADLYIGHNLGALSPAVNAARRRNSLAGYDAEDFLPVEMNSDGTSLSETVVERVERSYMSQCTYITAASPGIAEAYAGKYGIAMPVTILNVFPLAQRPSSLRPTEDGATLKLYWFSQTIGESRGLEDAVRAMGMIADQGIELHLRGWWQDGYEQRLRSLAAACGVQPGQLIWHPPGPPDDMVRLAGAYDVGLALELPTTTNRDICLTNKIFTYLLAGSAVVATNTRGQRPIVDSIGEAGFAYEAGDAHSLAEQLRSWLTDRAKLERARRVSWACGTQKYNWDREKELFVQTVESALRQKSRVGQEAPTP